MELNQQQKAAAEHEGGHVLVLAGAGTGKTRTIIARAAFLIGKGVPPNRILLLTFTRRAANEMLMRLEKIVRGEVPQLTAGTFHHFCLYAMRRMARQFGVEGATVIDRDDQVQLMKLIRGNYRKKGEQFPKASELTSLYSYARNTVQSIRDYMDQYSEYEEDVAERICRITREYDERKQLNNYLDFDDILFRFAKRLHEDPSIRDRLRGFYDHVLVDEMQDTNPLQWLILDGLRDPAKLFCVGDDAQSIYAFRGADFRNVHSFTERVPHSVVLRLEKNYRSTQGILDLSNWLLNASSLAYNKNLSAFRKTKSTPKLLGFDSDFDEARWIAEDLIERNETGGAWRDHMIITRTGYGARAVEAAMVEKKIPYRFIGGTSLLQAAHVKDLFSLVRASSNHHDELAWARYLTLWPGIGDVTASRLIAKMKAHASYKDAFSELGGSLKKSKDLLKGIRVVADNWKSPVDAIQEAARFLARVIEKKYDRWDLRKRDFDLLVRLAGRHRSLAAFLETYTLDPISATSAERLEEDDIVTLTTAHSAKGTEAQVCYLIRVEPGMYPHIRSIGEREQEEEERRILYVAMTRAKDELIITRTYRRGGSLRFLSSAMGRFGGEDEVYLLRGLDNGLVDEDIIGFSKGGLGDYDTIHPWDRD